VGDMDFEHVRLRQEATRAADQPGKSSFGQFRKDVRIDARVDHPRLPFAHYELEARPFAEPLGFQRQPAKSLHLSEGVGHGSRSVHDQPDDRQISQIDGLTEMQR
jgi:hypothetical protein